MRAGQPIERGPAQARAAPRGGRARQLPVDSHPGRLPLLHGQSAHRLDDADCRGTGPERALARLSAGQGAGRVHRNQRHDLHARPGGRLRPLAPARQYRLGMGRRPALFREVGGQFPRRDTAARRRRRVGCGPAAAALGHPGSLPRRGRGDRDPAARRLQRRQQRRFRPLRGEPAERDSLDRGEGLPAPGAQAGRTSASSPARWSPGSFSTVRA